MTQAVAQRSFAAGELAPSLYAHTDLQKYYSGLRTCRNMYVLKHGGLSNRPGTQFITEVKNSANPVRFIPFERSRSDAFVLEFGNLYVRMLKNGAYLSVIGTASGWVQPFPYSLGDSVVYLGAFYVNITGSNPATNPLANTTDWYPLTNGIYELPTPYIVADLPSLRFAQRSGSSPTGLFGIAIKATELTITHPSYAPRELSSSGDLNWALSILSFAPTVGTPVGPIGFSGGAAGLVNYWAVTAVSDTNEESLVLLGNAANRIPSAATPTVLTWTAPVQTFPAVVSYRIYRSTDGVNYGFIGSASGLTFSDIGTVADMFHAPPGVRTLFNATDSYPTAVAYYQQRLLFGNTNKQQETAWGSRTAQFTNFSVSFPLQDDDGVTFTIVGRQLNAIQHLLDLGKLVAFTMNEEKVVNGDDAGILRPDAINPTKISANGTGVLRPIEIGDSAIYAQARGTILRDLKPLRSNAYVAGSYEGNDLTVWAGHLFQGFSIVDWDFAQSPNSIVWAVRSDGVLLGLTYLPEFDVYGWHRHDTDGVVENVCVIPEGAEDKVYLLVRRTINGVTKRYIERMVSRFYDPLRPQDAFFVDCGVTFDGWNTTTTYVTLTGGTLWDNTELLTVTSSVPIFSAGDVGNAVIVVLTDALGVELSRVTITITAVLFTSVAQGYVDHTVPVPLQGVARYTWALAKKVLTGLSYLEGKTLSVLGDGYVVASPNNVDAAYPTVTVTGGVITLPQPYAVIRLGLPYISDMQPLDLDLPGGATIKDKKLLVNEVGLYLERSRGVWIGDPNGPTAANPVNNLREWKARSTEVFGVPVTENTDFFKTKIKSEWGAGRYLVRQVDPLPMTILSATPIGYLPQ